MAKERKSPQQKKQLQYEKDHFTPGWFSTRGFNKTLKRKKAAANRQYRRRSEEILAEAKVGITGEDMDSITGELTAGRFQKSVGRRPARKIGTITLGEKVREKLKSRKNKTAR